MEDNNTQMSDRQLAAAIWYVKHKERLRRIVLGFIILVDATLLLYAGFSVGIDAFGVEERQKQEFDFITSQIPLNIVKKGSRPNDLLLGGVDLVRIGDTVDVLARVQNPNTDWYVMFEYTIGVGDEVEVAKDGFLLPGEERPLFRSFMNSGGTLVFNIDNVSWQRVNTKEIPDYGAWRDERLNFEIKDAKFFPSAGGDNNISRAKVTLTNNSAVGYFEPNFLILLYRGSRLVGIQSVIIDNFQSGETRDAEVSWFGRIGGVTNVDVMPAINIFDLDIYIND